MPYGHLIATTVITLGVCQGHSSIASFLPRDAMLSAVYAVVVCVCVCVCLSHSGIVSKRLNVGSRK